MANHARLPLATHSLELKGAAASINALSGEKLVANWTPTTVRFVAFTHPATALPDASAMWNQVFGSPPQTYQMTPPQPNGPPVAGSIAQGTTTAGQTQLHVQFGRVDIAFPPSEGDPSTLPSLANLNAALAEGQKIVGRLGVSPVRLALVFEAHKNAQSISDANKMILAEVPAVNGIPDDAIDISFSINRRISSHAVEVNRLLRWSIGTAQFYQFQMVAGNNSATPFAVQELHFLQLSGDFNTVPMPNALPLPTSAVGELWSTLVEQAQNALSNGYASLT